MHEHSNLPLSQTINNAGAATRALLFGAQGPASNADIFATLLKLASAQLHHLTPPYSCDACLAHLAALCRLDHRIVWFLPPDVAARIGPLGPTRPHAVNAKARVREAVVHATLLLELQQGLSRSEGAIYRNLEKIEHIATDFLTNHYRAQGGREKIRVTPEPVSARTIRRWLNNYEGDLTWGLYEKPPRRSHPVSRYRIDLSDATSGEQGHNVPSNIVPLSFQGKGRAAKYVPWWMRHHP